jgi:CBS domain containing-hemolysin-like protein
MQRSSKAVVVDAYGGVQGLISIEDVLGELFGEIGDELKQPESEAEPLPDGTVRLSGSMRLDQAQPWLRTRWEGAAATVGGHIVFTLGRLPTEGESFEIDDVGVTVTEMSPTAVRRVVVRPRSNGDRTESDSTGHEEPS